MHTPTPGKTSPHPMMIIAAVAVVLFCVAGTAAIMGWIPSSIGGNPDQVSSVTKDKAPAKAVAPVVRAAPARKIVAAPVCDNCGRVESVNQISSRADGSGIGAAGGAVLGGLLGNQVGGGNGKKLATVAGAIGGAVIGNQVEGNMKATQSAEIVVRLDNGGTRTLSEQGVSAWRAGDRVRIVNGALRAAS